MIENHVREHLAEYLVETYKGKRIHFTKPFYTSALLQYVLFQGEHNRDAWPKHIATKYMQPYAWIKPKVLQHMVDHLITPQISNVMSCGILLDKVKQNAIRYGAPLKYKSTFRTHTSEVLTFASIRGKLVIGFLMAHLPLKIAINVRNNQSIYDYTDAYIDSFMKNSPMYVPNSMVAPYAEFRRCLTDFLDRDDWRPNRLPNDSIKYSKRVLAIIDELNEYNKTHKSLDGHPHLRPLWEEFTLKGRNHE